MIDFELESAIHDYLLYRKRCFNNYVQYSVNIDYDKIINARYSKISRIKKRLLYLISHRSYVYFITFTFSDSFLYSHCERSRKDIIKNCLKSFDDDILIILNKDFGSQTQREHYHAIIGSDNSLDMSAYLKAEYPYFTCCERVRHEGSSIKKISKYINKLSNHCIKDTTQKSRLYFNFKGYDDKRLDPIFYRWMKSRFNV